MAEPQYRFGGSIPESVQRLKARREFRASSLYARVKRGRRDRREEELAAARGPAPLCGATESEQVLCRRAECPPAA